MSQESGDTPVEDVGMPAENALQVAPVLANVVNVYVTDDYVRITFAEQYNGMIAVRSAVALPRSAALALARVIPEVIQAHEEKKARSDGAKD